MVREAHAWLSARYETAFPPYYGAGQWGVAASLELMETAATFYEFGRMLTPSMPGVCWIIGRLPRSSIWGRPVLSDGDQGKAGAALDGRETYRLTVPANAPATQYWSTVVYDRATHALVRNASWLSRSSQNPDLQKNGGGSVIASGWLSGETDELDTDQSRRRVRSPVPGLRTAKAAVRQDIMRPISSSSRMPRLLLAADCREQYAR